MYTVIDWFMVVYFSIVNHACSKQSVYLTKNFHIYHFVLLYVISIRYLHLPAPLWSHGLLSECYYTTGNIWHWGWWYLWRQSNVMWPDPRSRRRLHRNWNVPLQDRRHSCKISRSLFRILNKMRKISQNNIIHCTIKCKLQLFTLWVGHS